MKNIIKNWLINPVKVLLYSVAMLAILSIGIIAFPFILAVGVILFVIGTCWMEVYGKTPKSFDHF